MQFVDRATSIAVYLMAPILFVAIMILGEANASERLKLNTGTRAPYTTEDQKGFLDQVIAEIFRRIGHEAEVVVYDASARALANANSGVDAGAAMRIKGLEKKYPNLIRVSEKLIDNDFVAYSKGQQLTTDSWQSLDPYSVAYILGWQIFERNIGEQVKRERVADAPQLFNLLDKGRVDVVLYERWQGLWRAKHQGIEVTLHEPLLAKREMYIYLHKNYAHLVEPATSALAEMKSDGSYQAIVDRTLTPLASDSALTLGVIDGVEISQISKKILREAYRRLGLQVNFRIYPGKRSLIESNSGRIDGELFRIKGLDKQYPNLMMVPVAVNELNAMVFTKDKTIKVDGWESLRGYKAGVRRGIKYAEAGTKGFDRVFTNSYEELFEMLEKGLIDFFTVDRLTGMAVMRRVNGHGVIILEPPVVQMKLYPYLHRDHRELVPKLTRVLTEMEQEGFMRQVREQFVEELER